MKSYQSTANPCPLPRTTSGANESAFPHIVKVLSLVNFFANLKSTNYKTYISYGGREIIHLDKLKDMEN